MRSDSTTPAQPPQAEGRPGDTAMETEPVDGSSADPEAMETGELLGQLRHDRLWLLRQIDAGRWPAWRLDLAALERELGLLLEQAEERQGKG